MKRKIIQYIVHSIDSEKEISQATTYAKNVSDQLSHSADEPDVIDCTSNQDNEPDYLSVKMSDIN